MAPPLEVMKKLINRFKDHTYFEIIDTYIYYCDILRYYFQLI